MATGLALTALAAFALGSAPTSGSNGTTDGGATTTTSALGEPTEIKVSVSGKTLPNYEYIRAICDKPKEGTCSEIYGLIPKFTPELCPKEGGTFSLAALGLHGCPKEHLVGTCHYIQSRAGEPGELVSYYANSPEAKTAKAECNGPNQEWIDAPAPPPARPSPAASAPKAAAKGPAKTGPSKKK
ncbi:MAG: hypothetical protein U0235_29135 [Polyangiaceae bacterium]